MKYIYYDKKINNVKIKDIISASELKLKVLFFAIKNSNKVFDSKEVALILSLDVNIIDNAIEFWASIKIIDNISNNLIYENQKITQEKERFSNNYLSKRIQESDEISLLLDSVQTILGRPISGTDISAILGLKDSEGLPCDVILMLIQYCVEAGKISTRYIEKVGIDWARNDINSVELAEERIKYLSKSKKAWYRLKSIFGLDNRSPTEKEKKVATRWFDEWKLSDETVRLAYERCVNSKGKYSLSYIDGIIKRWKKDGIKDNIKLKSDINMRDIVNSNKMSYDLEDYEKLKFQNF
ncbi:MAG: DnaD domain protein [Oscillospiraceae bacterium]|jgi:DnaD/phage-associated family protein|nr:DnaD domain protein [Oscillospiraceae bacterium]